MFILRSLTLTCLAAALSVCHLVSHAQIAPIERRAPQPPLAAINTWPPPETVPARTRLLVSLGSGYGETHLCRLGDITPEALECEGRHHTTVSYPRRDIESLSIVQAHCSPLTYFVGAAAIAVIVGLGVGSPGLILIGLVAGLFAGEAFQEGPQPPQSGGIIYLAPRAY